MSIADQLRYIAACFAAFGDDDCAVTVRNASLAWSHPSPEDERASWREAFGRIVARFDASPSPRRTSVAARCGDLWRKAFTAVSE